VVEGVEAGQTFPDPPDTYPPENTAHTVPAAHMAGMNTTQSSAQDVLTHHAVDVVDSQDSQAIAICRCGTEVPELEHVDHQLSALAMAGLHVVSKLGADPDTQARTVLSRHIIDSIDRRNGHDTAVCLCRALMSEAEHPRHQLEVLHRAGMSVHGD